MKKKETEIATNVSSGAEKVEVVEKEIKKARGEGVKKKTTKTLSAKGDAALGDSTKKEESVNAKKVNEQMSSRRAEAKSEAAKARVQLALKRKEAQAKRKAERAKQKAEKAAKREKRMAEKKAAIEKRAVERKALAEKRAAEREAQLRERAHAKANRNQAHSKKKAEKTRKKATQRRESRAKSYGGWIAAVVALGVTTLALATTVTVGAVEMSGLKKGAISANRATMYELTGIMEHVDNDLDRVRISASPVQQSRILTDLLVQARLAETDLEKLPVTFEEEKNIIVFINRTAMECERMLSKLRRGDSLDERDLEVLEGLYKANHSIRQELEGLTEKVTDKDMGAYLKGKGGMISETLNRLDTLTLEENRAAFDKKKEEMKVPGMRPMPENGGNAIDGARAVELCDRYFTKYKINNFQCVGETVTHGYSAYNVQGYDEKGTMLFAEIDRQSGKLVGFEYYEDCSAENFDLQNAERIAEEFLDGLGYDDMEIVKCRESGSTAEFTFLYEEDGVVYYPDEIRVKVCRTRGVITGMDATKYLRNHRGRVEVNAKISLENAREKLSDKLNMESARLAVVNTARGERTAYEFLCSYQDTYYYVYVDAETGEEIAIINAQNAL
ncbi:MAG: germination protein YpeB [Clostridia bacterium]|nr:germination protein YpeB [Clostridia bacterium]